MNHFSLPRNLVLSALLAGLLGACATRQQRETVETPPPPPEPPAQKSSPAPESAADSETVPEETTSADQAAAESGEEQLPAQTAEDVALNSADDTGERAVAENQPVPAPTGGDDETDQPASGAGGETEPVPAGGAAAEAAESSDQRFREAMRRFDRRLARERFGTEQRDQTAAGGGAGNGGEQIGGMAGGTEEDEQTGSSGSGNPFEGDGQETEHASGTGRGGIGERNTHSPPPGTPDGHDDDIVARQLREAAESEPDPELRERLWEEYRAYKNDQE